MGGHWSVCLSGDTCCFRSFPGLDLEAAGALTNALPASRSMLAPRTPES